MAQILGTMPQFTEYVLQEKGDKLIKFVIQTNPDDKKFIVKIKNTAKHFGVLTDAVEYFNTGEPQI